MPIFQKKKGKLERIKEVKIQYERDLQKNTEDNLLEIFGLKFISSEFALNNFRLDTLAFDENTNSFVILEYKRNKSFSVIDQGFSYLSLMLNNKADFILEFNERMNKSLQRGSIDWSQSRVLFLAHSFTDYQKNSINFKDLPIELWEIKKYENNTILYNPIKAIRAVESINKISSSKEIEKVSREVKKYTSDEHFREGWGSKEIFSKLRERIFDIDDQIEEVPTKTYIGYKLGNTVLFDLTIRKSKIEVHLYRIQPKDVKDPQKQLYYIKHSMKYWNKHVSRFYINSIEDIEYTGFLIEQVYNKYKK